MDECACVCVTCSVQLQCRQQVCGVQLYTQCWDIKATAICLSTQTLQEDRPCSSNQIHQRILLRERESYGKSEEALQTKGRWKRLLNGSFVSHRLQFDSDALGMSPEGRHPSAQSLPHRAAPLQ